ncbi:hypothetical protein ANN_23917 [Periplaneta americana]|uniref:Histone-lysine N-methyltransferase SETMAR n=1 Tax=Periplaneta americana TaxID=6978 RepID=A0ABQ8S1U3_PERAM|nr:hypothetical protein ANN_23917 [Periplaneta americana]
MCRSSSAVRFAQKESISCETILENVSGDAVMFSNELIPDLAPSDFHLFLHLKKFLGDQRFDGDDEVKTVVREWFASQFYNEGIERLVPRLDKCHNNGGDYVEK